MQNLPFPILWCRCLSLPATRHGWRKIITFSLDIPFLSCYNTYRSVEPNRIWGYSSAGRALEWHSRGQRFDPAYLHQKPPKTVSFRWFFLLKSSAIFCKNGLKFWPIANLLQIGKPPGCGRLLFTLFRYARRTGGTVRPVLRGSAGASTGSPECRQGASLRPGRGRWRRPTRGLRGSIRRRLRRRRCR